MGIRLFRTRPDGKFDMARGCVVYPLSIAFTAYRGHDGRLSDFRLLPGIGDSWESEETKKLILLGKFVSSKPLELSIAITCSLRASLEAAAWAYANRQCSHGTPLQIDTVIYCNSSAV
jgi:hypothetical protein